MAARKGQPEDDVASAPESGTVRDDTSGNNPAKGGKPVRDVEPSEKTEDKASPKRPPSDPSSAPESGTVR